MQKSNTCRKSSYHSWQAVTTTLMKPRKCSSNKDIIRFVNVYGSQSQSYSEKCTWKPHSLRCFLRNKQTKTHQAGKNSRVWQHALLVRLWGIGWWDLIHGWWEYNRASWQHLAKLQLCWLSAPESSVLGMGNTYVPAHRENDGCSRLLTAAVLERAKICI